MATEIELHPLQGRILRDLLFVTEARFNTLKPAAVTSDRFAFHLKRLSELGLVEKTASGSYRLSAAGKEFANRLDTAELAVERQAKVAVAVSCVRGEGESTQYLIQQRLKQPYYGFYGFLTGKVRWGETVREAAERELFEETGLSAALTLIMIKHKMDYSKAGALLEDKYFFMFAGRDVRGKLTASFEGGKNLWLTKKELAALPNHFDGLDEGIKAFNNPAPVFSETKYTVSGY